MQAINLDIYNLSLLTAKEDILNARTSTNWALFTYDGVTNNLKLSDSGAGGLTELAEKFHIAKPMYGLCRLGFTEMGQPRVVMICWVGENVDEYRQKECMSHVPAIKSFFKEAQVFISASTKDEVTEDKIGSVLAKVRPPLERMRQNSRPTEKEETVGTNYKKTNAAMEMRRINRDSFWARAEREEEERKEEERRKATEERRRLERERILQEKRDAEERDRKMEEKLQMIEDQRRLEAKLAEETKRHEKTKWELQQREHEEEMRARLRRSESIEKAAEAAAVISQRSMNPREFFRQLSSSSQNSSSPVSPRTGKPVFRRYQRSLTDTAFIFEKASTSSGGPTSPLSPTLTSPFSRTPTSPFNRLASPPSPSFRPVSSPPTSPPVSPGQRSEPPVSSLPSLPISRPPPPQSSPPHLPSTQAPRQAPPVSPGGQASLVEIETSVSPGVDTKESPSIPDAPTAALPESPVQFKEVTNNTMSELTPEVSFVAKETLVEEDEEVVALEEPYTISPPPSETQTTVSCMDGVETPQPSVLHLEARDEIVVSCLVEVEEHTEDEEPEDDQEQVEETIISHLDQLEPELLGSEDPTLAENPEDEIDEGDPDESEMPLKSGNGLIGEDKPEQNGVCPQNGTVKEYVDSSEQSTPERGFYEVNCEEDDEDEDDDNSETEMAPENGESRAGKARLCVRAIYDYQAEDDSELSFEPGDVISHVEMVDKSWWRGYSKDGRQGLFPANYVETI